MISHTQSSLFRAKLPLAEVLRPNNFDELFGNIRDIKQYNTGSIILWGPPGVGKTSYARILGSLSKLRVIEKSAVSTTGQEFKEILRSSVTDGAVLLIIDEIHHLNKSQQDIFLPYLEDGSVTLIGSTTENPSFELRPALLSRCRVIVFNRLSEDDLEKILIKSENFKKKELPLLDETRKFLCKLADGDARYLLNIVEEVFANNFEKKLSIEELSEFVNKKCTIYDKNGDEHYNLISALHKSMRGSDPDASLYWFARMINGGEDPLYIARRVIRCASEDIGMADTNALVQAIAAMHAYKTLGSPEGELSIAQAIVYVATAPKSNSLYTAFKKATRLAKENGSIPPPKHILNAPTTFMKKCGYSDGYIYDHDTENGFSGQNYFPGKRENIYNPVDRGFEREIKKRLSWWQKLRDEADNK